MTEVEYLRNRVTCMHQKLISLLVCPDCFIPMRFEWCVEYRKAYPVCRECNQVFREDNLMEETQ